MAGFGNIGAQSPRMQSIADLLAQVPPDSVAARAASIPDALAAALGSTGAVAPIQGPGGQPPPREPMISNGDTSGFVPLRQAVAQGSGDAGLLDAVRLAPRAPDAPPAAPHHGFNWGRLAGVVGAALSSATGNDGPLNAMIQHKQLLERMRATHDMDEQDKLREPRVVGDSLVLPDGNGGYRAAYTAPDKVQPFESYARAQGLVPGTAEYAKAVQDYRLAGWSDEATANRLAYQAPRLATAERNTDVRADTSRYGTDVRADTSRYGTDVGARTATRGQDLTHGDRVRGQDLTHSDRVRGQDTSAATTRGSFGYQFGSARGRGRGANPGGSDLVGQVFTRGTQRVQYSTKAGAYVDLATGKPVHQ